MTGAARTEMRAEAFARATNGQPNANYHAILEGFLARGIPTDPDEARP